MYKKVLITGVNGQVGHAINTTLTQNAYSGEIISLDRSKLDLSNQNQIRQVVQAFKPELIVNPAAYTGVDKAETEPDLAYAINATAPRILAEEAAKIGARLIHFSTDYVFNGNKSGPYIEQDITEPLSVYGKSKLAGEDAIRTVGLNHLIFRTSWVYGAYGKNFLKTILRLAGEREELRIVADQFGAPTSAISIAEAIAEVINEWPAESKLTGTYHMVNTGKTSWHGFATAIVEGYRHLQDSKGWTTLKVQHIQAIPSIEFPTPAVRPANSCLDTTKLMRDFSVQLPQWQDALNLELENLVL